ncbi:MAG: PH domain-containing protein [Pseudomonadales bacterium]
MTKFDAPWGLSLKVLTLLSVLILLGLALIGLLNIAGGGNVWLFSMLILPLAILIGSAFFTIRGYHLTEGVLKVQRLGWESEINLKGLQSVEADPEAMDKSFRTFGNGGLFCFAGKFRNKRLGSYRAFATDPKRAVTLKFPDRTIVVTPGDPEAFVAQVSR